MDDRSPAHTPHAETAFETAPDGVDAERPSIARVYDYWLGGTHNFAVDRAAAKDIAARWPGVRDAARANRAFLGRAVRHLARLGVRQFLDLGAGIPTAGGVYEVAAALRPDTRVVYVDNDDVVVRHSQAVVRRRRNVAAVHGDVRDPAGVLADPALTAVLDFSEPVAVLMLLVLPLVVDDEEAAGITAALYEAAAPGSYLLVSHGTTDGAPDAAAGFFQPYARTTAPIAPRTRSGVTRLLGGFEPVKPGVVDITAWWPEGDTRGTDAAAPAASFIYGALARKPGPGRAAG